MSFKNSHLHSPFFQPSCSIHLPIKGEVLNSSKCKTPVCPFFPPSFTLVFGIKYVHVSTPWLDPPVNYKGFPEIPLYGEGCWISQTQSRHEKPSNYRAKGGLRKRQQCFNNDLYQCLKIWLFFYSYEGYGAHTQRITLHNPKKLLFPAEQIWVYIHVVIITILLSVFQSEHTIKGIHFILQGN